MLKQAAFKCVSVGDILAGKYRVEKILGMGGMGVVVAATHLDLRELRAIKLIRPDAECDQSVERFLREARTVVRLRSEHVAEVHDVGRLESGAPYIVMELLEGQDLSTILKTRGSLPIEEAILYVAQACHALAEAHAVGIVHRDLKPGNLFLTHRSNGSACIKVLDFGISKDTKPEKIDLEMTGAKDLIGSPLYMSPEQMRSARKVDPRADVWALGAILYKLLTGLAPFQAPTVPEIFALTLGKQVRPPSSLRPEIPGELDAIILRCLDKQAQNRFPTAAELGSALVPFGPWEPSVAEPANQLFQNTRRTTVPPPSPAPEDAEATERDVLGFQTIAKPLDMAEPMTGLARSNKITPSGPISTWSRSRTRSMMRPRWLAFVACLSIFSAFVGATIVTFVARTPSVAVAQRPNEMTSSQEFLSSPVDATSLPVLPSAMIAESSANLAKTAPAPSASAMKPAEKPAVPKMPRNVASVDVPMGMQSARMTPSAAPRTSKHGPAKPEGSLSAPHDPFPLRE